MAPASISSLSKEQADEHLENAVSPPPAKNKIHDPKLGDAALAVLDDSTIERQITAEEDAKVLRKIDRWVLPVIFLVYFFQQLDKFVVFTFF
jgi:hypothetical protein